MALERDGDTRLHTLSAADRRAQLSGVPNPECPRTTGFFRRALHLAGWEAHAHDGSLAWHSLLKGYQPVCTQQACYFLQDSIISPGTQQAREHFAVLALRASDGKLLWQRTIPLQGNASGSSGAILAVFGRHLYLGVVAHCWMR